jgi:hypothetical protein
MWRERALAVVSLAALMLLGVSCVPAHAQTLEPNWIQQSPATSPSERYFQSMAYDASHGKVVLFGGYGAGGFMGDTWLWNGNTWTQGNPASSPAGRSAFAMTYDAAHGQVVLFGGRLTANSWTADTWLWNGTTWSQASPATSPGARSNMVMTYDATHGNVVLFGGLVGGFASNDTWIWNGTNWIQQAPAASPSARSFYSMSYDANLGQVVLFGGSDAGSNLLNDTWVWNGTTWIQQSPSISPPVRFGQSMDYDAALGETIMFGGFASAVLNDTWAWNGTNWTQLTPQAIPSAREAADGMVYDPAQRQLLLFGGLNGTTGTNDTWGLGIPQNFGNVNVCPTGQSTPAPCNNTMTLTYSVSGATYFGAPQIVVQGAAGNDFTLASGSTCVAGAPPVGTCSVNVTFTPQAPGLRTGAVKLVDPGNNLLTTTQVYGNGQGSEIVFGPSISGTTILNGPPLENVLSTPGFSPNPRGMTTDASGNLYIADPSNERLLKRAADGTTATVGTLGVPQDVAIDGAGNLFVADTGLRQVVEIPAGCILATCQVPVYSPSSADPVAVVIDGMGDLFIADPDAGGVVEVPAGCTSSSCYIPIGSGWHSVNTLAVDAAGDLFIPDSSAGSLSEMPAGCTTNSCRVPVGGGWIVPQGVAVDAAGDVYVSDTAAAGGIGQVTKVPAGCASNSCEIALVTGIFAYDLAVDELGQVYAADGGNHQVLQINQAQPPSESFDTTYVGNFSDDSPQSFTIQNAGNETLSAILPGLAVAGVNFAQVSGSGTPPDCTFTLSLAPGALCNVGISFLPQVEGALTSTATFTDNNLNGNPAMQIVNLSGSGLNQVETLNLTGAGTGNGSVVASPTGINCSILGGVASGPTCSSSYLGGEGVSLEEVPSSGYTFAGWGGACASAGTSQFCNINTNVNTSTNVTASFAASTTGALTVTEIGTGFGTVTDNQSQISCSLASGAVSGICTGTYPGGTLVTLTANPTGTTTFLGWGGSCASSGTNPTCSVAAIGTTNVTASFSQQNFGSVNVCPAGQTTPAPCNSNFALTFNMASTTTIGAIQVVTQGIPGLDFSLGSDSTCTGTIAAGNSCTVNVNFAPLAPGLRAGAVELFDNNGNPLTSAPIYGVGQGPAIAFGPGTQTTVATGQAGTSGVAVDAAGDVFISESGGAVKITPYGTQTTLPTSGLSPYVYDVAVDGAGDVFLADAGNNLVVMVTPSGVQTTVPATGLSSPTGVAVDGAGDVFITDTNNNRVVKVTPGGVQTTVPTTGVIHPYYPAVDAAGDVYFLDSGNGRVLKVTPGGIQSTVPISGLAAGNGVAVDAAGDVFVSDQILNVVFEVTPSDVETTLPTNGLYIPAGLAVDAAGDVFIADNGNSQTVEVNRSLPPSLSFALTNVGSTSADSPQLISVQNVGNQSLTGSVGTTSTTNFQENTSPASTCGAFTLVPGATCNESFSFTPQGIGILTDGAVFSDNTLNLASSVVVQTVKLNGIGSVNGQTGTAVPNVVGMTEGAAATTLTAGGLTLGAVSSEYSNSQPAGSVIGESPAAGAPVNLGSAVALLISTGVAPPPAPNPLTFENNYFVTGDFATAGVNLREAGAGGVATGTINIPDSTSGGTQGVPDGSDIVDGFLYWESLENTATPSGNNGTFLGYPITGQQIGSDLPYTDAGANLSGTLRVYRADINAYFQLPASWNGARLGSGAFTITLPDSGKTGQLPLNEGASLVIIYRALSTNVPLKSVVIYDGSTIPSSSTTQTVRGFYDAVGAATPGEVATLYSAAGNWNSSPTPVTLAADASQYTVNLNSGNAYAAVIFSTPVANSDNDGILNAWKRGPQSPDFFSGQPGYYDVKTQSWVPLPGAKSGEKDLFVQLDYMCGAVLSNGQCDPSQENLFPSPDPSGNDPLAMVQQAFASTGIVLHMQIGNAVPESTCTDSPGQPCQFPGEPGVIGWKNSLEFSKLWPRNFTSCASGGDCTTRFPYGQKDSYHYVLIGHSLAIPAWNTRFGTLTAISASNSTGQTTVTTTNRGAQGSINYCPSRFTISGVLSNPSLNGVYNTLSCPDTDTIILSTPGVSNWSYSYATNTPPEPGIGLTSGTVTSISGYSDLGGADSAVTLALWETAPNQDMSKRAQVIAGTLFHEIGHTLGLSHGGLFYNGGANNYVPTFDVNCKPNYQSSMNYLFQLDGVGQSAAVAYSNQTLETLSEASLAQVSSLLDINNNPATFSTTAWYTGVAPSSTASPATLHCDGSPLTGDTGYRVVGSIAPPNPAWSATADPNITFDGVPYGNLPGYNDFTNIDLRQVGATGGEYASLATVLSFGSSSAPLSIASGGSVSVGAGGTATVGTNGSVTVNNGGSVTVPNGAVISGAGTVMFSTGVSATLSSTGTIAPGTSGLVTFPIGGNVTLSTGGTITMGGGGTITMGGGGNITMTGGGIITLPGGGTVTVSSIGGAYDVPAGGIITMGGGGHVTMSGGGAITMGGGGTITMGGGGTITMGGGGHVTMSGGGAITMGGGGTITMGGGGNITMSGGGTITMGGGGTITMGGGGNITMGGGGRVTMGGGGDVSVGSGGNVSLANGGSVTLTSGGTVTVNSSGGAITMGGGGRVTMSGGGTITMGGGGQVILGSGGGQIGGVQEPAGTYTVSAGEPVTVGAGGAITMSGGGAVTMSGGGAITMGGGGTVTMGGGGNITMTGGGVVSLGGAGGNVTLGGGGAFSLGGGGAITMGGGGATTTEIDYNTANSIVRPPPSATYSVAQANSVQVNWTPPAFGVVQTYTISRSVVAPPSITPTTPVIIGSVSGVNGFAPATTFTDTNPPTGTLIYTIATTLVPDTPSSTPRSSGPSPPAVLTLGQTIVLGPLPSSVTLGGSQSTVVTATAYSNNSPNMQLVSFGASGPCSVGGSSIDANGVSSATVIVNSTGNCTVTASQAGVGSTAVSGATVYSAATPVSGTFTILPKGSNKQSQTINFAPLASVQYGNGFSVSASSSASLPVSFSSSGPCTVGATTGTASGTTTGAGLCTITASAPGTSTYTAASVTSSFNILTAPLTVTAHPVTIALGQSIPSFTYIISGFVNSDTASVVSGAPTLSTTATATSPVGSYPITISTGTLAAANYSFLYVNGTLTIGKTTATITVTPYSVTYNGSPHTATGTATGVGGVSLSGLTLNTTHTAAGVYTDTWTFTDSTGTYNNASGTITDTILPAPLVITASSASMIYGGPVPPVTPSYMGFAIGQSASNLTTQPICATAATSTSPVGTYSSTCTNASDSNYSISYVAGTVQVSQASTTTAVTSSSTGNTSTFAQSVTFTATVTPKYNGTTPTGTATFYNNGSQIGTGKLSQGQATFSTSSLPASTANSITAIYGGDGNFTGSTSPAINQTVRATPIVSLTPLFVSFGNQNVNTISSGIKITLTNVGDAALTPITIGLSGEYPADFIQTNNCPYSLGFTAPNNTCTITVAFAPVDTGALEAALTITSNDDGTSGSQQYVSLAGGGLSTIAGGSLFSNAIFATAFGCDSVDMRGGSTVDSFDSSLGFNSSHTLSGGNVGANGTVSLNGANTAIYGTVSVWNQNCNQFPSGFNSNGGRQPSGGIGSLNGPGNYPAPPLPNTPPISSQNIYGSCGSIAGCSNTGTRTVSLAPGSYGNLGLSGGTTMHVSAGTYNFNSFTLSGNSVLYVDSGPVYVNIAGASLFGGNPAMDLSGGTMQNPTGIPANLQFSYAGSQGVNISGGSGSYATVYAPNAPVNLSGGSDFFGSIIGSIFTNSGGVALHYDRHLAAIKAGNYIWFNAVVNNVKGLPSGSNPAQVKLYMTNSTIKFTANGTSYSVPVPNAVVTFNSTTALGTTYSTTSSRWSTSIPPSKLTGNTFVAGIAFQVPANFPAGIQNVSWSAAFSTDTPGITLQWQWGAAIYTSLSTTYATSTNSNALGVNPEDGAADLNGRDPAGTPETYKGDVVFGATGCGSTDYAGHLTSGAGVVPSLAPVSVSPSSLDFGTQAQRTTSTPLTAILTNNDSVAYTISSITTSGTDAGDFAATNNCPISPNTLAAGASCTLSVTFTPGDVGTRTAKVNFIDGASNSPQTVYLSGSGH